MRTHWSGQALVRRARVVLLAAMGYSNMDIARAVPMDEEAVGLWRRRWHTWRAVSMEDLSVADRLTDAPRPGAVPRLTAEQVCQIVALACEQPTDCGRPVSQWSHRELADEIVRRETTDGISPRHAGRLLKAADLQPHRVRYWLTPAADADRETKIADVLAICARDVL